MADMVHSALRRKLAAAQAIGDVERIAVLRKLIAGTTAAVETPADAPVEAPIVAEEPIVEPVVVETVSESPELGEADLSDALDSDW